MALMIRCDRLKRFVEKDLTGPADRAMNDLKFQRLGKESRL